MNVQIAKLEGVLSVKSVNVVTKYRNLTQRIIGLSTTLTANVLENVLVEASRLTDAEYMSFPEIKSKNNVHNVHDVHPAEDFELRQLGNWYFSDNQAGFEDGGDYSEYDAGSNKSALRMQNMIRNLTWPDFEVSVDGSMIILKRVKERYFPRKKKDESSQLNDKTSKRE